MVVSVDELKSVRKFVDAERRFSDAPPPGSRITIEVLDLFIAEAKRAEERRELEASGEDVRAAAEAGWNALRVKNPKVDREDGAGNEISAFEDLPHKVKLNYLTFAAGALYANVPQRVALGMSGAGTDGGPGRGTNLYVAPAGTALPADPTAPLEGFQSIGTVSKVETSEPVEFKAGDRVKITGPKQTARGYSRENLLRDAQFGTVIVGTDEAGDARIQADTGLMAWIAASSLTKTAEPRTWLSIDRVPNDVNEIKDCEGDVLKKASGDAWTNFVAGWFAPYTEVLN